jgi:hypothetical protein
MLLQPFFYGDRLRDSLIQPDSLGLNRAFRPGFCRKSFLPVIFSNRRINSLRANRGITHNVSRVRELFHELWNHVACHLIEDMGNNSLIREICRRASQ